MIFWLVPLVTALSWPASILAIKIVNAWIERREVCAEQDRDEIREVLQRVTLRNAPRAEYTTSRERGDRFASEVIEKIERKVNR